MPYAKRALALLLCLLFLPGALAQETSAESFLEPEIEGVAVDVEPDAVEGLTDEEAPSIEGLTPLYTTQIKPFVSTGTSIRMRARQDGESDVVCVLRVGDTITIYKVYPSYVLAEFEGIVGYVIRTWIEEKATVLDPQSTPPYGVTTNQYVATLTQDADIYMAPSLDAQCHPIRPTAGNKVAILAFEDGFAKVLYWRSYGYIDARLLTDLVVVSQTEEPMSPDTPIAAFCSFFEYNTGDDSNTGRCLNIVRSCELMTRTLEPGETLDFNGDIGPFWASRGYHLAPVLADGGSRLGYGGGTCQSSSTFYNAVRQLPKFTVLMRRSHGPGCAKYLPMHQDAAVGNSTTNLIVRNDYDFPLRIVADSNGEGVLCIQIFRGE